MQEEKVVSSEDGGGRLSRRSFLNLAFVSSLTVLLSQWGVAVLRFLKPSASAKGGYGGMVYAGKIEEFPIGEITHVLAGRFYILRTEKGLLAMWHRCTHLGCAVPWVDDEDRFHCPCHGSIYNKVGEVLSGPAPRPLDLFPVVLKDGEVWVDTGNPIQRARFEPTQITPA